MYKGAFETSLKDPASSRHKHETLINVDSMVRIQPKESQFTLGEWSWMTYKADKRGLS